MIRCVHCVQRKFRPDSANFLRSCVGQTKTCTKQHRPTKDCSQTLNFWHFLRLHVTNKGFFTNSWPACWQQEYECHKQEAPWVQCRQKCQPPPWWLIPCGDCWALWVAPSPPSRLVIQAHTQTRIPEGQRTKICSLGDDFLSLGRKVQCMFLLILNSRSHFLHCLCFTGGSFNSDTWVHICRLTLVQHDHHFDADRTAGNPGFLLPCKWMGGNSNVTTMNLRCLNNQGKNLSKSWLHCRWVPRDLNKHNWVETVWFRWILN